MSATDRHAALLRGINVGRAKRVAMADLRVLVERLGYTEVRTLLNSGNVVFTATPALARGAAAEIEAALSADLGVSARVAVVSAAALDRIVAENALAGRATDHARLFAAVLMEDADRAILEPLADKDWGREAFAIGSRAAYLWCPDGASDSPLTVSFARVTKDSATTRNWATVLKLQALLANPSA